jgi:hypothetical protein
MMSPEIEGIIKNFLEVLADLIERFGEDPVELALEELLPGFAFEVQPKISARLGDEGETVGLQEAGKFKKGMGLLRKTKDWVVGKVGTVGAGAAGLATGAAGKLATGLAAGAATLATKSWDQDVNIDGVSTDDTLNVKSKPIEDLLAQNQEAIQKMIQVMTQTQQELSKKLGDLDKSVDYLSTDGDETADTANIRQDLGLSRQKTKKEPEKEKKAKEMEKAKKREEPVL